MIEIINISKKFGELTAVDGVSFTVKDKECFSLLGFNGAGKTTLINLLTTCLKPTSGGATINGYDIVKDEQKIKPIINIAPQEIAVAKNLTVKENLELIADLYGVENRDKAIDEIIEEFGLAEKAGVQAKKLSGGQLKRLSIALAVITRPGIFIYASTDDGNTWEKCAEVMTDGDRSTLANQPPKRPNFHQWSGSCCNTDIYALSANRALLVS